MDRERLDELLRGPAQVAREDLAGLKDLNERYPWFSGAQLLMAMGQHAQGDVLAEGTVRKAAAHIPSREVLFDAIHAPALESPEKAEPVATMEAAPTPVPEATPAMSTPTPVTDIMPPSPEAKEAALEEAFTGHTPDSTPPTPLEPHSEGTNGPHRQVESIGPDNTPEAPPEEKPLEAEEAAAILERQMLEAALSAGYALTREHPPADSLPSGTKEPEPPAPPVKEMPAPAGPAEVSAAGAATQGPTPKSRMRFTEWLTVEQAPTVADPVTLHAAADPEPAAPATASPAPPPADVAGLIDRFIASQHPEPKPKASFFKPQEAARRSVEEQPGLVTETLARIHEAQGNTAKARAMYERLALKYPEKSAYFAALAKKLEAR
jgi:hypothetical protein